MDGEAKPDSPKPGNPPISTDNMFRQHDEINFRFSELLFKKAIKQDNDILLLFAVDDDFDVIIDQVEFFLYAQEVFQRSCEAEEKGQSYLDVCEPLVKYYGKNTENVNIYLTTSLIDNLGELEEDEIN